MSALLILAAGGHAKVVAETALASGVASSVAFLDDRSLPPVLGWPVLGPLDQALEPSAQEQFTAAAVAIGHPATRMRWIAKLQAVGYQLPLLVHPRAWISPSAHIGPGSVVFAQAAIQAQAVIAPESGSTTANTGLTPSSTALETVAMKVRGVVISSSPWPRPMAR